MFSIYPLPLSGLGLFNRQQIDDSFLIFPSKKSFEISIGLSQICMKCQKLFSEKKNKKKTKKKNKKKKTKTKKNNKNKKKKKKTENIPICSLLNFLHSMLSVTEIWFIFIIILWKVLHLMHTA